MNRLRNCPLTGGRLLPDLLTLRERTASGQEGACGIGRPILVQETFQPTRGVVQFTLFKRQSVHLIRQSIALTRAPRRFHQFSLSKRHLPCRLARVGRLQTAPQARFVGLERGGVSRD